MLARLNLNLILAAVVVVLVLYYAMDYGTPSAPALPVNNKQTYDSGMYDFGNENVYGTVAGPGRNENMSVRPEFSKDPFPIAEGCTLCNKKGIPNQMPGHTHVCKAGLPSKRMIDAYGGSHFELPHMCAPSTGAVDEPSQLGRFWKRKGCSSPQSAGLDMRPICSRCGN